MENIDYNRNKGLLWSVVMGKSPMTKIVKTIKTEIKKGKITVDEVDSMLNEIFDETVKAFEGSKAYPTLFQERNNRFEDLKNELNDTMFATP